MTNWQQIKLCDVCDLIAGFAFKSKDFGDYPDKVIKITNIEPPFVNMTNLSGIDISKYDTNKLEKFIVQKGDYVLAMTGATIGKLGRVYSNWAYINQRVLLFKSNTKADKNFLYYILADYNFSQYVINHVDSESAQANISATTIGKYEFSLPPLEIQKKIAGVLGALDDKIELNNKINNNLEQQMYALVEQDILNIETKIFLDEFCNVFTGRKNANEFEKNGVNKFFTCGPDALTINSFIYDGSAIIVSGNGAYTGRTRFYKGKFDLYQRTYACTIKENIKSDYIYILYPILKLQLEKKLMGGTHGSAIPYIVMNDIAKFQVPFNEPVFNKIAPICKAIIDKIQANEAENEKLSQLRDTLLPKLMSGEVDVSKVDISALTSTDKLSFNEGE